MWKIMDHVFLQGRGQGQWPVTSFFKIERLVRKTRLECNMWMLYKSAGKGNYSHVVQPGISAASCFQGFVLSESPPIHAALRKLFLLRPATIPIPRIWCPWSQQSVSFLWLSPLRTAATPARKGSTVYSASSTGFSASDTTSESTSQNSDYCSCSSVKVCFEETGK